MLGMSLKRGSTRHKQDGKWQLKNSAISMDVHSSLRVTVMDIAVSKIWPSCYLLMSRVVFVTIFLMALYLMPFSACSITQ